MLEYCFVEAPGGRNDKTHGIPNLELMVANDPAFFAKPVSLFYERNDYCQDPPGWHSDSHDRRKVEDALRKFSKVFRNDKEQNDKRKDGVEKSKSNKRI